MRLLAIDGNSIINRAFYGIRLLSTKDGTFTNAVVGFFNILDRLREQVKPDGIAVAFDVHAPTFRHKMYDGYKAGRKHMPDELFSQMPLVKEILRLSGCTIIEKEGYEADDILGTLAACATASNNECFIATGDRDSFQLISDSVHVLLAATKAGRPETIEYTPALIQEKYGLTPSQMIDLKALMGDSSDCIPGVPGVGEKTALSLLSTFHSLDELYEQVETSPDIKDSVRSKLIDGKESAYLSKELGTICCTVPIETDLNSYMQKPIKREELSLFLAKLELFKFIERWELNTPTISNKEASLSEEISITVVGDESLPQIIDFIKNEENVDILFSDNKIAICMKETIAVIEEWSCLIDSLIQTKCTIRTHDSKLFYVCLLSKGIQPKTVSFDTKLAAYLLNPLANDYDVLRLAQEYNISLPNIEDPFVRAAAVFPAIADTLVNKIEETNQTNLLIEIEIPLALVLADMEYNGFAADAKGITAFSKNINEEIIKKEQAVYDAVGYTFNINSPKQLGKAFFEDLQLPHGKKTKSGYSTSADVLEKLRPLYPVVDDLLQYRMLAKLKSTYCDGLLKVIDNTGRIHSSFNQTETRTGRISSTEPNLQNIPVRSELGKELRRFFIAKPGHQLCDADYSQIELRVLAALSEDPTMTKAFQNEDDIHTITASQVFNIPENEVTPLMRSRAKAVNFGIVYGIGAHSLSEDIGSTYAEAKQYIDSYLSHYGNVRDYMDSLIQNAKDKGYSETIFGRRRPLPELRASNGMMRAFGERVARNMPIQGTAADIIKIAMIHVYNRLKEENMQSKLILQVHDELIVEAPDDEAEKAASILKEEMEKAVVLSVPFSADVHIGKTWYDAKG